MHGVVDVVCCTLDISELSYTGYLLSSAAGHFHDGKCLRGLATPHQADGVGFTARRRHPMLTAVTRDLPTRDWKTRDQTAGVKNSEKGVYAHTNVALSVVVHIQPIGHTWWINGIMCELRER